MPISVAPDAAWWDFNGTNAALRLQGTDPAAEIFDPSQRNDDFTVAGTITPGNITDWHGVFCKWNTNGVDKRCWLISHFYSDLYFMVSKDGLDGGGLSMVYDASSQLAIGETAFFCGRYQYLTDGTSVLQLRVGETDVTPSTTAVGPVFSDTAADVQVADNDAATGRFFDGEVPWLAYWNRKLTDDEVDGLTDGSILPQQLNPDWYWDGHRAVAATYESDIPQAWTNREFDFDVEGTPTHGGSSTSSADDMIGIGDELLGPDPFSTTNPLLAALAIGFPGVIRKTVHPRATAKVLGPGEDFGPGTPAWDAWRRGMVTGVNRESVHPRQTAKSVGIGIDQSYGHEE